jgi:Undecaprenyl-phosphate galactose phosphotransferase WbaP
VADLSWLAGGGVAAVALAPVYRALARMAFGRARWWGVRVIVVGSGGLAARTFAEIERRPQRGLRPIGFVDDQPLETAATDPNLALGTLDMLGDVAVRAGVNRAVIASLAFDSEEVAALISHTTRGIDHWLVLPVFEGCPSLWTTATEVAGRPALAISNKLNAKGAQALKRLFDLSVTATLGLAALPLFVLLYLLVRLGSPGPVFYSQERIGRHGRRFRAWKFRSMLANADSVLAQHLADNPELSAEWKATHKLKRDPRVTWIGQWLRKSSLDELPQVWNVLCGEMSLVGPRPIVEAEIDKYADHYEDYVRVLPGITGLWQISGRNNTTYDERVGYDAYYVRNWSLWFDLYILATTVKVVLLRDGAY